MYIENEILKEGFVNVLLELGYSAGIAINPLMYVNLFSLYKCM